MKGKRFTIIDYVVRSILGDDYEIHRLCELIPTVEDHLEIESSDSLRDYDIAVFNPSFPYLSRIDFSAGGSCLSIESTSSLFKWIAHWSSELTAALQAGKTVFIVLNAYKEDSAATGTSAPTRNTTNYSTTKVNNYRFIPGDIKFKNARGKKVILKDPSFGGLYEVIKGFMEYRVVINDNAAVRTTFTARDGAAVGGVIAFDSCPGHMVLLPFFDFEAADFTITRDGEEVWTDDALRVSHALVAELVAIDRNLKGSADSSVMPTWMSQLQVPKSVAVIENDISEIDAQIDELQQKRDERVRLTDDILEYYQLVYETGSRLERAVEKALRLLDYNVENLRIGDLEIDHVIVGPSGQRMIGESEGKDTTAIHISKFRQLESNVGEDFERDEIDEPAKGVLFGNGFRLTAPNERPEQFTPKCLTNAKRLGSALVRTADLYLVAVRILDHPEDEAFKAACREAIEQTVGALVQFPLA